MKLIIDTHIWVKWVLGDPAEQRINDHLDSFGPRSLGLSAASLWELKQKHRKGGDIGISLQLDFDKWVKQARRAVDVVEAPITFDIALRAAGLPRQVPKDPADRFIVATAQSLGLPLLTRDAKLLAFAGVAHYQPS